MSGQDVARIQSGSVLVFRFLDVADDLDRAEVLLQPRATVRRISLRQESSAALALGTPPIELDVGALALVSSAGSAADNAVKVASDLILPRVYLDALERQHAPVWRESVTSKLRLFSRVYDVLEEEAHAQRSLAVEVTVVVLIALEIAMAFLER